MARNTEKRTVEIIMNGSQPAKTMKELNSDIRAMTASLRNMDMSSDAWESHSKKLKDLKSEYKAIQSEVNNTGNSYDYLKNQMKGVAIGVIGGNLITSATQSISQYFSGAINGIANLSDELADIRKVSGLTGDEVDYVNSQLSKMDTRTARSELRGLAYEAGKLGNESVDDVLGFVAAADKINIALGEDLGADAVTQIGKLVDIFHLKEEFGLEKGMLKIASSINTVGAASTANEGYLVEFLKRMSGVSGVANISAPQIIGLAGTLDSLGQTAEVSTTALSKLLTNMGSDVPRYAKMAGVSVEQFRAIMNQSGLDALLLVIEQMGKSTGGLEQLAAQLGDIGVDGGRVVGVLGTLAKNMDEVRRQTDIATESFNQGTSVLDEYNIKNETTAAKIEKLKKQINSLKESQTVKNIIQAMIDGLQNLINTIRSASVWWDKNKGFILSLAAAWAFYNIAMLKNIAITKTAVAWQKTQNVLVAAAVLGVKAIILAEDILTGKVKIKIALERVYQALLKKNPYVFAISGLIALGGAIATVISKQRKLNEELRMKQVKINVKVNSEELDDLSEGLKKLKGELSKASGDQLSLNAKVVEASIAANKDIIEKDIKELSVLENKLKTNNENIKKSMYADAAYFYNQENITTVDDNQIKIWEKEVIERKKIIKEKEKTLKAWEGLNQQYISKIDEEKAAAAEAAKQREELNKEELERIKKLNEEYQKSLIELQKLRSQALVQVIDDEYQRELAQLKLNHSEKMKELRSQVDEEIALAKKLGKSKTEIAKIEAAWSDISAGQRAEYNRQVTELNNNKQKELADEEYQQELQNLAKRQAGRQILLNESYKKGEISKQQYEDALADLEVQGKEILLSILKDYSKDTTDAELELSNMILKITQDTNERRASLELAAAERRLAIAQMEIQKAQQRGIGLKKANEEFYLAQQNLLLQQIANELELTNLTEEQKLQIKKEHAEEFEALQEQYAQAEMERRKSIAMYSFDVASQFANEIFNFRSDKLAQELAMLEESKSREQDILEEQKERGYLTDAEYQARKERLDADYDKKQRALKRKQAVNDKMAALFNIAIQTALNVTQAFPNFILMGVAAALGITQAALVAARPVPQYAKGVRLSDKILTGPSHESSWKGIQMIDPRTGHLVALAEGGEVILSKKTVKNNPEIVSALLDSSMYRGGQSISSPQYYSDTTAPVPLLNAKKMTAKVRDTTLLRNGGYINTGGASKSERSNGTKSNPDIDITNLLKRNTDIMEKIYSHGIEAYFDYQKFEVEMEKQNAFKAKISK